MIVEPLRKGMSDELYFRPVYKREFETNRVVSVDAVWDFPFTISAVSAEPEARPYLTLLELRVGHNTFSLFRDLEKDVEKGFKNHVVQKGQLVLLVFSAKEPVDFQPRLEVWRLPIYPSTEEIMRRVGKEP